MEKIMEYCGAGSMSTKGWFAFNGKCCVHNGDMRNDTKKRAGMHQADADGFIYHCFNCGYKTGWKSGDNLGHKTLNLLNWFGVPDDEIQKIKFKAYQLRLQKQNDSIVSTDKIKNENKEKYVFLTFPEKDIPKDYHDIDYCLENFYNNKDFINAAEYLVSRGEYISEYCDFLWSPSQKDKIIIPCKWNNKNVGFIYRSIYNSRYRYINDFPSDYLFNTDEGLKGDTIFLCEGPFDAYAISGIATLGDKLSDKQETWLKQQNKRIIVVPDMVKKGGSLVDIAIKNKWETAVPDWDEEIKDCADAAKKYGPLFTVYSLINSTYTYEQIRTKRYKIGR